jgi:hypothetical protein
MTARPDRAVTARSRASTDYLRDPLVVRAGGTPAAGGSERGQAGCWPTEPTEP